MFLWADPFYERMESKQSQTLPDGRPQVAFKTMIVPRQIGARRYRFSTGARGSVKHTGSTSQACVFEVIDLGDSHASPERSGESPDRSV